MTQRRARGTQLPQSRLTEAQAKEIRENRKGISIRKRAKMYGVHPNTILRIDQCLTWRHV